MEIQKVIADKRIQADSGRVALRFGPLIYNVEAADQQNIDQPIGTAPLTLEWKPDFLNGVMTIKGKWSDGTPLIAVPNFARLNRLEATSYPPSEQSTQSNRLNSNKGPESIIWIKK